MNKALVVGVSKYRQPFSKLPAVASDVREIAKVLQSRNGAFARSGTVVLADNQATKAAVESALVDAFKADDTAFVYIAGHGAVENDEYYFIPHDAKSGGLKSTAVSLAYIKRIFDKCQSERVFLWLDCCHSGGILKRAAESENAIIERTLKVVQGQGRVIIAACTAEQFAYEDASHGMFTGALLSGLKGKAEAHGEVTASSLYDCIDREIGSDRQRPVLFGDMRGRIVLMNYRKPKAAPRKKSTKRKPTSSNLVMLGREFVDAQSVKRTASGEFEVEILSHDAERDAMVQGLCPQDHYREPMPFAYRNDACDVEVAGVTAEASSKGQTWNLTLKPTDSRQNQHVYGSISEGGRTYTADDIAELRARLILLGEKRPVARHGHRDYSLLDSEIRRTAKGESIACPIRDTYKAHQGKNWKEFAKLQAIYLLKMTGTIEHVLELNIGRIAKGQVPVSFRGRCRPQYANQEPTVIEFTGECPLT